MNDQAPALTPEQIDQLASMSVADLCERFAYANAVSVMELTIKGRSTDYIETLIAREMETLLTAWLEHRK